MKVYGVIPARFRSARFQGKPLAILGGRPMIQHVYERAKQSTLLTGLVVATDDKRIFEAVESFCGEVLMTSPDHPSGTDRVAEAAGEVDADVIVNIQGDEPFISPRVLDHLVEPFRDDDALDMSTLKRRIQNEDDLHDSNVVKVVVDAAGYALYFSRSLIPNLRHPERHQAYEHIGLYAYRKAFLLELARMPPTLLEQAEGLEQLRVLENGRRIRVVETEDHLGLSVDTPADLAKAERFLAGL